MKSFKKILVANRGEIAVRIIRAAQQLGIRTMAVFSDPDRDALHVRMADESAHIGSDILSDSYLNIKRIVKVALERQCDAIHPGYGFLAENPDFVKACEKAGIIFIGPDSKVMALMGNKIQARKFIRSIGIPLVDGVVGTDPESICTQGKEIGFPLLLKAAAGGGGKGMRIVWNEKELKEGIETTSREALTYFGDGTVYLEKYLEQPRHIEFQILGDHYGNVIHLFERECSIQRRYQKIIEESPSVTLDEPTRINMSNAAVKIGREIKYTNAGTIEFLVDKDLHFYFLEMNTRIQVEHPVTELTTGVDLVQEQIKIAAGNPLTLKQEEIRQTGHAIEARIYAEDPSNGFLPSPGKMSLYREPEDRNFRVDSGVCEPVEIHSVFDPLISKLNVLAPDRERAIKDLDHALSEYHIHGIQTNIHFLRALCRNSHYQGNIISTTFCDMNAGELNASVRHEKTSINTDAPAIACFLYILKHDAPDQEIPPHTKPFIWYIMGLWRNVIKIPFSVDGIDTPVTLIEDCDPEFILQTNNGVSKVVLTSVGKFSLKFSVDGKKYQGSVSIAGPSKMVVSVNGWTWDVERGDVMPESDSGMDGGYEISDNARSLQAPMPGKVIKIGVKEGDKIKQGQELMVIEAMKMENKIVAGREAFVKKIEVRLNQMVDGGKTLIVFE